MFLPECQDYLIEFGFLDPAVNGLHVVSKARELSEQPFLIGGEKHPRGPQSIAGRDLTDALNFNDSATDLNDGKNAPANGSAGIPLTNSRFRIQFKRVYFNQDV